MSVTCAFLLHFWVDHSGVFHFIVTCGIFGLIREVSCAYRCNCTVFHSFQMHRKWEYICHTFSYIFCHIFTVCHSFQIFQIFYMETCSNHFLSWTHWLVNATNKVGWYIFCLLDMLWKLSQNTNYSFIRGASFHQLFSAFPRLSFILCLLIFIHCLSPNDRTFIHFYSLS